MASRIILHIGRHKSGTSSLQHALARSAERLARAGFLYPRTGRPNIAHHRLAGAFLEKNRWDAADAARADALVARAKRELDAWGGAAVLSSEAFQNVIRPERLEALCDPAATQVIAYVRDPYAYAQSSYAQFVHAQRTTGSFETYLASFEPHYALFLARWREGFAPARFDVCAYDRRTLVEGDIVRDFAAATALPGTLLRAPAADRNPSIGGGLLAFKRAINALPELPQAYDALSRIAARDPAWRRKPSAPEDAVRAFRARVADEMRAVADDYPTLAPLLHPVPDVAAAEPDAEDIRAVWQAIGEEAPALADAIRAHLARTPPADPLLAWVAQAG